MLRTDYWLTPDLQKLLYARWAFVSLAASIPLGSALTNILTGVVLLTLIWAGGFRDHWVTLRSNPFALASIVLLLLIAIGALWSSGDRAEIQRVVEKHARILLAAFAVALMTPKQWRYRALVAWALAMIATLLLSYMHSVWSFPLARATRENVLGDHYIFKHHITQNVMMSVLAASSWVLAIHSYQKRRYRASAAWCLLAMLCVFNIFYLVAGRTGYLTLAAASLVATLSIVRSAKRWLLLLGVVLTLGAFAVTSDAVKERIAVAVDEAQSHDGSSKTSIGMRVEFAEKSMALIAERPIAGFGTGSYSREFCRVAASEQWCAVGHYNPHNQFLFFGVQLGLIGMVALLGWIVAAAFTLARTSVVERSLGLALLATFCIHSMLDSPLYINTEGAWYPLGLGLLAAGYSKRRSGDTDDNTA